MRYPASEKLEIIRLVERFHLPARRTLETRCRTVGAECTVEHRRVRRRAIGMRTSMVTTRLKQSRDAAKYHC